MGDVCHELLFDSVLLELLADSKGVITLAM